MDLTLEGGSHPSTYETVTDSGRSGVTQTLNF